MADSDAVTTFVEEEEDFSAESRTHSMSAADKAEVSVSSASTVTTVTASVSSTSTVPRTVQSSGSRTTTTSSSSYTFGARDVRTLPLAEQQRLEAITAEKWKAIEQKAKQQRAGVKERKSRWVSLASSEVKTEATATSSQQLPRVSARAAVGVPATKPAVASSVPTRVFTASATAGAARLPAAGRGQGVLASLQGVGDPSTFRPRRWDELERMSISSGVSSIASTPRFGPSRPLFPAVTAAGPVRESLRPSVSARGPPPGFPARPALTSAGINLQVTSAITTRTSASATSAPQQTSGPYGLSAPGQLTNPRSATQGPAPRRPAAPRLPHWSAVFTSNQVTAFRQRFGEARMQFLSGNRALVPEFELWNLTRWMLNRSISAIIVDPKPSFVWPFKHEPERLPPPAVWNCERCQLYTISAHSHESGPDEGYPMCPRCLSTFTGRGAFSEHLTACAGCVSKDQRSAAYDHRLIGIRTSSLEGSPTAACPPPCPFRQVIPAVRTVHQLLHADTRRRGITNPWIALPHLSQWEYRHGLLRPPRPLVAQLRITVMRERPCSYSPEALDMRLRGGTAAPPLEPDNDLLIWMFEASLPKDDMTLLGRKIAEYRRRQRTTAEPRPTPQAAVHLPTTPTTRSGEREHVGARPRDTMSSRDPRVNRRLTDRTKRDRHASEASDASAKRPYEAEASMPADVPPEGLGLPVGNTAEFSANAEEEVLPDPQEFSAEVHRNVLSRLRESPPPPPPMPLMPNPTYSGLLLSAGGQNVIGRLRIQGHLQTGVYEVRAAPDNPQLRFVDAHAHWSSARNPAVVPFLHDQCQAHCELHSKACQVSAGHLTITRPLRGCTRLTLRRGDTQLDGVIEKL